MPPPSEPKPRKLLVAILIAGLIFVVGIGWRVMPPAKAGTADHSGTAASALPSSALASASRSRMIEADPSETPALSDKNNAATYWRKAFALADKLTDREKAIINRKPPADPPATEEEIAALLAKVAPIMALLHDGAGKADCDWGVRAFVTQLPYTKGTVALTKIALWDARQRIADQPSAATANIQSLHAMGNNLKLVLTSGLNNAGVHVNIYQFLGENAALLTAENRQQIVEDFTQPSLLESLRESIRSEGEYSKQTREALLSGKNADGTPMDPGQTDTMRMLYGNTPERVRRISGDFQKMYAAFSDSLTWRDQKYDAWVTAFKQTSAIPMVDQILPVQEMMRSSMRQTLVSQSMTSTGLKIMDEGVGALQQILDPATGKPFAYRVIDENGTFELQSEVLNIVRGKPVALVFQRAAAQ